MKTLTALMMLASLGLGTAAVVKTVELMNTAAAVMQRATDFSA